MTIYTTVEIYITRWELNSSVKPCKRLQTNGCGISNVKCPLGYRMSDPNPWGVGIKVTLYTFDLGSDWVNGILMLTAGGQDTTITSNQNDTYVSACAEDHQPHLAWGSLTIGLSYVPALFGFFLLLWAACKRRTVWNWLLLPIRFIMWPFIVGLLM